MLQLEPSFEISIDNMLSQWTNVTFSHLSVILANLRYLYMLHQTHHWSSRGQMYYGDHLLFQRLYEEIGDEIDSVAERSIGLTDNNAVELCLQLQQMQKFAQDFGTAIPGQNDFPKRSLIAEQNFINLLTVCTELMREQGTLTKGLENLLTGILDMHETHIYLLKQRCEEK